ncbi:cytochrome c family protein [Mesorhizobium sp. SARCC-RB16n]|uniref:c-type cytochrome n=1 Tax=Mesorhizobium sp. SARCC-RB16n TaxID=2116687 RepID=UPI00122EF8E0|nr:c-type cytochrome [Mesorhizobium sp. SARCC-RB16n]KAA3451679.1 cytochrome c family protein [Mesorhizobium sp. SARCC-RB16n]
MRYTASVPHSVTGLSTLPLLVAAQLLGTSQPGAAADATAGQAFFGSHCAACHSNSPGLNRIGPSLAGVVGRKSGTVAGFNYSVSLKNAGVTWDDGSLDKFLQNPNGFVHGTKMFISVPNPADRQNIIAYLGTLKP